MNGALFKCSECGFLFYSIEQLKVHGMVCSRTYAEIAVDEAWERNR